MFIRDGIRICLHVTEQEKCTGKRESMQVSMKEEGSVLYERRKYNQEKQRESTTSKEGLCKTVRGGSMQERKSTC